MGIADRAFGGPATGQPVGLVPSGPRVASSYARAPSAAPGSALQRGFPALTTEVYADSSGQRACQRLKRPGYDSGRGLLPRAANLSNLMGPPQDHPRGLGAKETLAFDLLARPPAKRHAVLHAVQCETLVVALPLLARFAHLAPQQLLRVLLQPATIDRLSR